MKTYALPVIRTITTMGHILVEAESVDAANQIALNQHQLARTFRQHFCDEHIYELQTWDENYQKLFGLQGTDYQT
jgi:hypothetical protein